MKLLTFAAILFTFAAQFPAQANNQDRQFDAYDYMILAQETNGQCASPGAMYGCKYDSNVIIYK